MGLWVWGVVRWLCASPCLGFHVHDTTEGPSAPERQSLLLCRRETCERAGVQLVQSEGMSQKVVTSLGHCWQEHLVFPTKAQLSCTAALSQPEA